jgi:LmbE family N-acetylglucosaminyl deacetylase
MTDSFKKYKNFVTEFAALHTEAAKIERGTYQDANFGKSEKKIMLFSPHPDDECIIGALPLRLKNELDARVINVAMTLGSNPDRKEGRLLELTNACKTLGFELLLPCDLALDGVNLSTKENDSEKWAANTQLITQILIDEQPDMVFFPHDNDFNSTHIGVNHLLVEAITEAVKSIPSWNPVIIETEFWQMMDKPNLMIGLSHEDEATLIYAISAHSGEIERNPYHINHPARMLDNVTRGSEVVGGQGGEAIDADYAMIYRCSKLINGTISPFWENGKAFGNTDDLQVLLSP